MIKILITGASGLIGKRLTEMLLQKGYAINTLGRAQNPPEAEALIQNKSLATDNSQLTTFFWDIEKMKMDERALEGVTAVIHLAGAGVADKRWTKERKKELVDSRINSTRLLFETLRRTKNSVKTIVSASAVGYYGDCGDELVNEERKPASTFLAKLCVDWEAEVQKFGKLGIRTVMNRIGIVLSKNGGALPELEKTIPLGVAGYFAKKNLYYPWIHIDDVCGIFINALENEKNSGAYNCTAPNPILIKDLMQGIVDSKKSHALLIPVPLFPLKLALGEMAEMLLSSQRCSDAKVLESGYHFQYKNATTALKAIYS
jgi:hypothetical protein